MSIEPLTLADRLVLVAVRLTRRLRVEDRGAKLTGPQASALAVVIHSGRITLSDLATLEQVRRPTISRVAMELEAAGLVKREADLEDRRVSWLLPTRAGLKLFAAGQARRIAPLAAQIRQLEPADRAALDRALAVLEALANASWSQGK